MSKISQRDYIDYLELINDGHSQRSAAKILGIPRTTIQGYLKRIADKDEIIEQYLELPETSIDKVENNQPKICYLDIECSPTKSYTWRRFKENISQAQILSESFFLTASWAFNENEVHSLRLTSNEAINEDDEVLITKLWHVLDNSNVVVGHNLRRFDITRELYKRLRGFDNNAVNLAIMSDKVGAICTTCCSDDITPLEDKFAFTPNGKYQVYVCNHCNTKLRSTSRIGVNNKLVRVV